MRSDESEIIGPIFTHEPIFYPGGIPDWQEDQGRTVSYSLANPRIKYKGQEVTIVPAGETFIVEVDFNCIVSGFYQSGFTAGLSITDGHEIEAFESQVRALFTEYSRGTFVFRNGKHGGKIVMPDHDIILQIQPWFSNLANDSTTPRLNVPFEEPVIGDWHPISNLVTLPVQAGEALKGGLAAWKKVGIGVGVGALILGAVFLIGRKSSEAGESYAWVRWGDR